jgi:hypothetical protein
MDKLEQRLRELEKKKERQRGHGILWAKILHPFQGSR